MTAIEFAIIAPVLFLILIGILEFGLIFFTHSVLEGATNIGSRIGKTGFSAGGMTREEYIRDRIEELSLGLIDVDLLDIDILSYDDFTDVGQPEPCISPPAPPCPGTVDVNFVDINGNGTWDADMGTANAGGAGAVVLYRVTYPWQLFTPMLGEFIGDEGLLDITAIATVRNEPF